jgi:hypothetical protein
MKLALQAWRSLCLLLLALFGVIMPLNVAFVCDIASFNLSTTFNCDGRSQTMIGYDDIAKSGFAYDGSAVLTSGEKESGVTEERDFFTKSTKFLAAEETTALSTYRLTSEGETFVRYESDNPAFTRIGSSGGVAPGTFAAPTSDGIIPLADRAQTYNLPNPEIPRPVIKILTPPAGTPIIGPRPVAGGPGNEVIFPTGY